MNLIFVFIANLLLVENGFQPWTFEGLTFHVNIVLFCVGLGSILEKLLKTTHCPSQLLAILFGRTNELCCYSALGIFSLLLLSFASFLITKLDHLFSLGGPSRPREKEFEMLIEIGCFFFERRGRGEAKWGLFNWGCWFVVQPLRVFLLINMNHLIQGLVNRWGWP